ncbi:hypothetical protein M8J76_002971 [Diaphorina citri]|nr:hypothetical protein M8J76_002971 [Diaphorina citri]
MNSDKQEDYFSALSGETSSLTVGVNDSAALDSNKQLGPFTSSIMNNNLNIIDSNFSDDQLDQTNFIPFATNLSENIDNGDQEQNTLNASDAIDVDSEFNAKMVSTTDVIDEKTKTSSVLDSSNVNEINIVTDVGMEDKTSSVSNDNSKGEVTSTASDTIKVDMVVNNDILTENEILKKGIDDKNLSKDSENVDKDVGNKSTPADASKDNATTLDKKIEEIMNSSGLNGCDANQLEECNAGEGGIENKTTEENVPTGFKELMNKNIDSEIQENKDPCIQKESVSGDDNDDKGDGTLYIDEGNDQEDGKSKDDADSETEKKTKDILDTTTEEEEEDEDEKAFGDNIKEKKKKLIKKAADIQAAEKIDIEAFKSEWSDEDDGNEDEEKSSNKGIKPGQGTKNIPAEVSSASKFPDVPIPEDIIDSSDKDTENIPNDTEVNPEDEPNKTSSEKHDKNTELSHDGKICEDIIVGEAKENEASRETMKEASNVTQTPKFNEETISGASKAPITSKSETIDTSDNTVNTSDNAANTSGNTEKTESSLDENLEESMLIEEISQDGDTMEVEGQDGGALEVEQEAGEVVLEGGEHEEAIVVIGGSNGENLEDFVIVNENNEEQEIFEEIGEDGTKTYYVKVKPSTSAPEQDPSDKTETSETPVETEKETEPEEQAEETAVPVARRGRSPKCGSEVALFAKKTKGRKLHSNVPDEVARDLALQQLESPQLKRRAKRNTDPILVKPSAGPVLGPKVKTNLDDVAIKIQIKTDSPTPPVKALMEKAANLSKEKLEKTVQLHYKEKAQALLQKKTEATPGQTQPAATKTPKQKVFQQKVLPKRSPLKNSPTKNPASKISPPAGATKKPARVVPSSADESVAGVGGDATPSRKSTRLKIENQTLKDYAVDLPESCTNSFTESTTMIISKSPVKPGRPAKRRLQEDAYLENTDSKRFMISYANTKKRLSEVESEDSPNPVIPPLIIENGKDIVDRLLSGEQKSKRRTRGVSNSAAEDLIIVESPKKKKMKEFDPSLIPSASELVGNQESSIVNAEINQEIPSTNAQPPVDPTPTEPVPTTTPLIINTTTGGPTTKRAAKSSSATSSPRLVGSPRASGSRGGLKAKIPANTWNVTSEADDTEEETREGMEEVVVPTPSLKKLKKSTGKLSSPGQDEDKKRQKVMREINKLLGDEGAINMLYSVNQKRNRSGDSGGHPVMETALTNKKMKKNLLLKTKLVKSAVLNLTSNSEDGIETPQGRLRKSAFKPNSPLVVAHRANRRKVSLDSVRSSVSESNVKSPLRPVIAESVIFRRHSSDSSCSSSEEEEGEERRTSKDEEPVSEETQPVSTAPVSTPPPLNPKLKNTIRTNLLNLANRNASSLRQDHLTAGTQSTASAPEVAAGESGTTESGERRSSKEGDVISEVEQGLESLFGDNQEDGGRPAHPEQEEETEPSKEADAKETETPETTAPVSTRSRKKAKKQQKQQQLDQQSAEVNGDADDVNVISVKICDDLAYISFLNQNQQNFFTVNILNELTATLVYLDRQDACKTILMMGAGFSSGVDLAYLLSDNKNKRRRNATNMANALKEFITTLAQLGKPILLGVTGAVVGAAVTILPLFDFVLASNTATFETLYHKLGQIPEAAATFTFPMFLGRNATSELLMSCKKISSQEAKSLNLITRICNEDSFEKNAEIMQTTKLLLRKDLYSQLNETLSTETDFLIEHWTSEEVQKNLKKHLLSSHG